jgi:hypothetical protein
MGSPAVGSPSMGGFDDGLSGQMGAIYSPAYNQSASPGSPGYDQGYNPAFATSFTGRRGVAPEMGAAPLDALGYPQTADTGARMGVPREADLPTAGQ